MEVEPILPRQIWWAASRVWAGAVVGVVGEGTPPLVDVDLLVLGAHLDALHATILDAFDLVIGGERDNLAALRAGKDRPLRLHEL